MEQNELVQEIQLQESAAKALTVRGNYDEALELIFKILNKYPLSPIYGLGFRIAREMSDIRIVDRLIKLLDDKKVLSWAIVAEQAATTATLGNRPEAERLLRVASKMQNATNIKLQPFQDRINVCDENFLVIDENEVKKNKLYLSSLLKLEEGNFQDGVSEFLMFLSQTPRIKPRMINEFVKSLSLNVSREIVFEISGVIADLNQAMADLFLTIFIRKLLKNSQIERALEISLDITQQNSTNPGLVLTHCFILLELNRPGDAMIAFRHVWHSNNREFLPKPQIHELLRVFKNKLKPSEYDDFISEFSALLPDADRFANDKVKNDFDSEQENEGKHQVPNNDPPEWEDQLLQTFLTQISITEETVDISCVDDCLNELKHLKITREDQDRFIDRLLRELGKQNKTQCVPILAKKFLGSDFELTTTHYATMMQGYAFTGDIRNIEKSFSEVLWGKILINGGHISALIKAYSRANQPEKAEGYLLWMDRLGIRATSRFHYGPIIESYRHRDDARSIERLLLEMDNRGCAPDTHIMNAYLSSLIAGGTNSDLNRVIEYFQDIKKQHLPLDSYVYTPYLNALARLRRSDLLTKAFEEMKELNLEINSRHLTQAVTCYSGLGSEDQVLEIWAHCISNPEIIDSQLILAFRRAARKNSWDQLKTLVTESVISHIDQLDGSLRDTLMLEVLDEKNLKAVIQIIGADLDDVASSTPIEVHEDNLVRAIGCDGDNLIWDFVGSRSEFDPHFQDRIRTFIIFCEEIEKGDSESIVKSTNEILIRNDFEIFYLKAMLRILAKTSFWLPMSKILEKIEIDRMPTSSELGELLSVASRANDPFIVEDLFRSFCPKSKWNPKDLTFFYNLVMRSYWMARRPEEVVRLHDEMIEEGLPLDSYSLSYLNLAYEQNGRFKDGEISSGHQDNIEWLNLSTVLDDVVHELSQWIGALGSLVPATITLAKKEHGINKDISANLLKMTGMVMNLSDRIDEYSAITKTDDSTLTSDLVRSIEWVVERKSPDAHRHSVQIHVGNDLRNHGVSVKISPFMFRIALRALAANAIEALSEKEDDGGARNLWITTSQHVENGTEYANIYFRDNGSGIPSGLMPAIFEKGFTSKPERGLGLGLSLVKTIIQSAGGLIAVTNNNGNGAEFWIKLPIER